MYTHTTNGHGGIDVQEVVNSEICRSEGSFTVDDVRERIAERIQPYMDGMDSETRMKTTNRINSFLEYAINVYATSGNIKYVGKGRYRSTI